MSADETVVVFTDRGAGVHAARTVNRTDLRRHLGRTLRLVPGLRLGSMEFRQQSRYYKGMWQETKHGLYRQFNFENFREAWDFMTKVAALAERYDHHPRWENEWNVVQIWLITHEAQGNISEKDREMAQAIDAILDGPPPEKLDTSALEHHDKVKLFADGGSRGNPGPSSSGFVILDMNDKVLVDKGVYLGITTNNQAEYTALKLGLEEAHKMGVQEVEVYMDSLLVVNQMNGIFKVSNRDLWPIHDAIVQLRKQFKHVSFSHVPREFNKLADAAVNRATDDELGITHN